MVKRQMSDAESAWNQCIKEQQELGRKIMALKESFDNPAPVPSVPEDIEARVDGMVNRSMNGFSFSDPDVPVYHPESKHYRGPQK